MQAAGTDSKFLCDFNRQVQLSYVYFSDYPATHWGIV